MSEAKSTIPFVLAIAALALFLIGYVLTLSLHGSEDDVERGNSSAHSSRPTIRTALLPSSSPPNTYSQAQTNTRASAAYHHHQNSSRSATYVGHSHRASLVSTHPQPASYLQPPSSTHTQPSHLQPPGSGHIAQAAAKIKATRESDLTYRTDLASQLYYTRVGQSEISTNATAGYGSNVYHTRLASHYVAGSDQNPSAFSRVQSSYLQPPSSSSVAQVAANPRAASSTREYDHAYRSSLASSRAGESHETFATVAARAHGSLSPRLSSTRAIQRTASTTTPADHTAGVHHPRLPQPCSTEASLTGLAPSPIQAAYQCTHVARIHVFEDAESRPTHSHTQSSSSGSGHVGIISSTQIAPLAPSRAPNVQSTIEFEAATTAEDKKAAIELRERARRSGREMRAARDLAKSARKRRDYAAEQRHKQDAIASESEMKSLDRRAAKIIFRENNKALPKGTVDLHGLYVAEAMEYAKNELLSAGYRNDAEICFIVGKGLHSEGGKSKLRPHLQRLCDERQLTYSLDPKNAGKLRIQLN